MISEYTSLVIHLEHCLPFLSNLHAKVTTLRCFALADEVITIAITLIPYRGTLDSSALNAG